MGILELKKKLQECVKGVHIEVLSDSTIATEREWFQTPSYDLNRILSGSLVGGLPSKSLTLLVAPEASFKSSFMCLCAAKAQKQGMLPVIFDTEGAWTKDFVSRWGLDPDNMLYVYTPWIDQLMTMLGTIINGDDSKLFIILDSMGGLEKIKMVNDANKEQGVVKADQGTLQKEIKRMLKMLLFIVKGKNSTGMIAGHFFGNPNSYGGADEIGGGKFAKLAPDIIVSQKRELVYVDPKAKAADRVVKGTNIKAMTLKNRFYPPFQEATISIDYKNGVNPFAGLVEMALQCGVVSVAGSWFTLPDGKKVQGQDKVLDWFGDNQNIIIEKLEEILKLTGYSTINEEVKAAEELKAEIEAGQGDEDVDVDRPLNEILDEVREVVVSVEKEIKKKTTATRKKEK